MKDHHAADGTIVEALPELTSEVADKTDNEALLGALGRLQDRAQKMHNSHYTKHGSHSVKHSSW